MDYTHRRVIILMFNEKFDTMIDGHGQFSVLFKFQQLQPFDLSA